MEMLPEDVKSSLPTIKEIKQKLANENN